MFLKVGNYIADTYQLKRVGNQLCVRSKLNCYLVSTCKSRAIEIESARSLRLQNLGIYNKTLNHI